MKRFIQVNGIIIILCTTLFAASRDKDAVNYVKTLINKSIKSENGRLDALRYFQYTATTEKNNPSSFILSKYGRPALKESGIKKSEKGKKISVVKDRSAQRIKKLWDENKTELFKMLPVEKYNKIFSYEIDSLVKCHESPEFSDLMTKIKIENPRPDLTTLEKAGMISDWKWYRELAFWHRRSYEKNDEVVYSILKELQEHYK